MASLNPLAELFLTTITLNYYNISETIRIINSKTLTLYQTFVNIVTNDKSFCSKYYRPPYYSPSYWKEICLGGEKKLKIKK